MPGKKLRTGDPPRAAHLLLAAALVAPLAGCGRGSVAPVKAAGREAALSLPEADVRPGDWPWWRGASRTGAAPGPAPPARWNEKQNILWSQPVPGRGHASPCVWRDRVFVSTADDDQQTMTMICLSRAKGELLWSSELYRGGFMRRHSKNSHASATPACDGQRVFVAHMVDQGIWVTANDAENGELLWKQQAGPFRSYHGYGSSPVLWQSLVIVSGDSKAGGFLTAMNRQTGDIVWRTPRLSGDSFATPVVATLEGREQLLLGGHRRVVSYDPATGEQLWKSEGPADTMANTTAVAGDLVIASGGYPQRGVMAIDGGSQEVVWQNRYKVYVPSPLVSGERLYLAQDNGIVRCLKAASGGPLWTQRLGGDFTSSPVLCGDNIYLPNESGTVFVFKDSDQFELLGENRVQGGCFASPAIADGQLFLRTDRRLYCVAAQADQ